MLNLIEDYKEDAMGKKLLTTLIIIVLFSFKIFSWEDHAQITYYSFENSYIANYLNNETKIKPLFEFIIDNFDDLENFFVDINKKILNSKFFNEDDKIKLKINFNKKDLSSENFINFYIQNYAKEYENNKYFKDFLNILVQSLELKDKVKIKTLIKQNPLNLETKLIDFIEKYFLFSLKINTSYKINYFIKKYMKNGYNHSILLNNNRRISFKDIAFVYYLNRYHEFYKINLGEKLKGIEIISTATDEPDYGIDISLFEDNGSQWGQIYKLGNQPYGNPKLAYGTQAPFHMAFYHESNLLTKIMPDLKRSYVMYRIIIFSELARFCFSKGEDYWGYRFAGWALHYIMDMSQPYHSSVVPGKSTFYLIFAGILDTVGIRFLKNNLLNDITYKHTLLEALQMEYINKYLLNKNDNIGENVVFKNIKETMNNYNFNYEAIIDKITKEAKKDGKYTDKILNKLIKNRKNYENILEMVENENYNTFDIIYPEDSKQYKNFENLLGNLLNKVSNNIRIYVKWLLNK
ncbi:MAG: hypothetical protein N3A58_03705 [Spirochaetes bacterium]|nr:hypothetical protein [Spirochaetota bacterium]